MNHLERVDLHDAGSTLNRLSARDLVVVRMNEIVDASVDDLAGSIPIQIENALVGANDHTGSRDHNRHYGVLEEFSACIGKV
jgi:hypothetical protein